MNSYIALLRGINVGGHNLLPMKELRTLLEELGLKQVRTYIQSGNVVFQSEPDKASGFAERITTRINQRYGFAPHVIVLPLAKFVAAAESNPFPAGEANPKSLHLFFLASVPENPDLKNLYQIKKDSEEFAVKGGVFYLHAPEGVGRSKVAQKAEKALGVTVTARNWATVQKLISLASE